MFNYDAPFWQIQVFEKIELLNVVLDQYSMGHPQPSLFESFYGQLMHLSVYNALFIIT